jgi:hypothetical protein
MIEPRLVGIWDVYHGPVFSRLGLAADGSYQHTVWDNSASHWGAWSYEVMQGQYALVMRLGGAAPLTQMTPFGLQPVYWPPLEAWAVQQFGDQLVVFADGRMFRETAPSAPPPLPAPMPAMAPAASAAPVPAGATARPVVTQWRDDHTDWAAVRQIYQDIYNKDRQTTADIMSGYQTQFDSEIKARSAAMQAMSDAIHAGVPKFNNAMKGIQSH